MKYGIASAFKQVHGFIEWQAYHPRIGSREIAHKSFRPSLYGITASFTAPFFGLDVALDIFARQPLEPDFGFTAACGFLSLGPDEANR